MTIGRNRDNLQVQAFLFQCCRHVRCDKATHKLAPIADKPCEVASTDYTIVAAKIGTNFERVLHDRVATLSVSNTDISSFVNNAPYIENLHGPGSPIENSEPSTAPDAENMYLSLLEYNNSRITTKGGEQ